MPGSISETVVDYVHAMTFADEDRLRELFDPRAAIVGNYQGGIEWLSLSDFIDQIKSVDSPSPDQEPDYEILGIDTAGETASVKLRDSFAGANFTNYLSLLQIDGKWLIVHKLYYLHGE